MRKKIKNHRFETHFQPIFNDNQSGSSIILGKTVNTLLEVLSTRQPIATNDLQRLLDIIKTRFPAFPVVHHFIRFLETRIDELPSGSNIHQSLVADIERYAARWQHVNEQIARQFLSKVALKGKSVLTHSASGTVTSLFHISATHQQAPAKVVQTVSYPAQEGKMQAASIAQLQIPVVITSESMIYRVIDEIDMFITGADMVYPDSIVNKTGTYMLCLLMKASGKPVYCLCDSRKFVDTRDFPFEDSPRNAVELWENPPAGVDVRNYYFEKFPRHAVDHIFTENGMY